MTEEVQKVSKGMWAGAVGLWLTICSIGTLAFYDTSNEDFSTWAVVSDVWNSIRAKYDTRSEKTEDLARIITLNKLFFPHPGGPSTINEN